MNLKSPAETDCHLNNIRSLMPITSGSTRITPSLSRRTPMWGQWVNIHRTPGASRSRTRPPTHMPSTKREQCTLSEESRSEDNRARVLLMTELDWTDTSATVGFLLSFYFCQ